MLSSPTQSHRKPGKSSQIPRHDRFMPQITHPAMFRLSSSSYSPRIPLKNPDNVVRLASVAPSNAQFFHVFSADNVFFASPEQTTPLLPGVFDNSTRNDTEVPDPQFPLAVYPEEDLTDEETGTMEFEENLDTVHKNGIAKALDFPVVPRMLNYTPKSKRKFGERYVTYSPATKNSTSSPARKLLKSSSFQHSFTSQSFNDFEDLGEEYDYFDYVDPDIALASQTDDEKNLPDIINLIPFRILDAPGLGNDFYSNLVSWSKLTSQVAVGLRDKVYIWAQNKKVVHVNIPNIFGEVTCVSFSPNYSESVYFDGVCWKRFDNKRTNLLAVGYKDGTLALYDVDSQALLGCFTQVTGAVDYICWVPPIQKPLVKEENENTEEQNKPNISNENCHSNFFLTRKAFRDSKLNFQNPTKPEESEESGGKSILSRKCQHILIGDENGSVYRLGVFWGEGNWICNGKKYTSCLSDIKQTKCLTGHTHKICGKKNDQKL